MSISLLRQLLMKEAVKKSAGSSGIMTINKNIAKDVEKQLQKYINDALAQGVDLDTLSPDQLKMIVAMNQPKPPKVFSGQEAMDQLNKLFPKKGELFDLKGKKLDPGKPIMGGTQDDTVSGIMTQVDERMTGINKANEKLGELLKEREIIYGKAPKTEKNPKIKDRKMFKEANERLNKTDVVADSVARITSMEPVAAMKEANKIIKREGIYKNLDETQSKKILQDTEDWIFQRNTDDLYDYQNNRPFRDDPNFDPDDPDYQDFVKNRDRDDYYTGGMVDVEPNLSDIGHGSDALMARTRLVSPNSQATTSTGLNYLLAEDNDNIRVPFGSGKRAYDYNSFDHKINQLKAHYKLYKKGSATGGRKGILTFEQFAPLFAKENFAEGGRIGFAAGGGGRRAFLKLMAALTGGAAAFKTGILGLGEGAGKKAVTETVKKAAGTSEVPPYFFKLVDKIKTLGDETLASQDKAIAKKYKDYVMEEDFAGNITIIKKNMDDPYPQEVIMSYKVDDVSLPSGKGMAKVDEYEEFTVRPDRDGKMKDIEGGVPDEVVMEVEAGSGNVPESFYTGPDKIKKADGGRIGFSVGNLAKLGITGSSRRFLEKVFGKEGLETMIKRDPEMHRGLLEVVEMFRNRDKEGLKMYMQKFLPHMDDATVEDFIIGGGGTEGIQGQLIRLGSGRDYAGKLEMIKKADNVRKLDNLDVTEEMIRKPNASGGIQTMLGE